MSIFYFNLAQGVALRSSKRGGHAELPDEKDPEPTGRTRKRFKLLGLKTVEQVEWSRYEFDPRIFTHDDGIFVKTTFWKDRK